MVGMDDRLLAAAVPAALRTPLGPAANGLALADVAPADRLAELDFELPMGSDDAGAGDLAELGTPRTLADVADLLEAHLDHSTTPWPSTPPNCAPRAWAPPALHGYLSGQHRRRAAMPPARPAHSSWSWTTRPTWLRDPGSPRDRARAWGYRPEVLPDAMMAAHYPLQALLYDVALHRYLRWRLPGYDPHAHLGGVLYLFLRGMAGPDTPTQGSIPCGVFCWKPPAQLVIDLSDLLDGRRP